MYVIALQGGGFKGAFQAPIVKALVRARRPDLILGVSVGAINGVLAAQEDFAILDRIWSSIDDSTPIDGIKGFMSPAIFRGKALFHLGPLRQKLEKFTSLDKLVIPFGAGSVARETDEYHTLLSSEMTSNDQLWNSVHGSAAIAGLMEPVKMEYNGQLLTWSDGGHKSSIPMIPHDIEELITHADIIMTSPIASTPKKPEEVNGLLESIEWAIHLANKHVQAQGLARYRILRRRQSATIRVFAPEQGLGGLLTANQKTLRWRRKLGYKALRNPTVWAPV